MVTKERFATLLQRMEDETLDFKRETYNLSDEVEKFSLIKDVLCMANTPREEDSYIILGVKKHPNGKTDLHGLNFHIDEADLQSQFSERVHPVPRFKYELVKYEGKDFGIIVIPPVRVGPCAPLRDYGASLRQRQIYFRRGSKNDLAAPEDVRRICDWIDGSSERVWEPVPEIPNWEKFIDSVHGFSDSSKYILLSNLPDSTSVDGLKALGAVDWSFTIDLDPDSDRVGLLKAIRPYMETRRSVHLLVKGDRPTLNLERGTYWFFARGLTDSGKPTSTGSWRQWLQEYGNEVREQIVNLAKASTPNPITMVALWYKDGLASHLQSVLSDLLAAYSSSVNFVIVTDDPSDAQLMAVADQTSSTIVSLPIHQLCSGLKTVFGEDHEVDTDVVVLPSSSGAPILLESADANWIEEEIELVHLNSGVLRDRDRDIGTDFLKGHHITWHELGLRYDVERDEAKRLLDQVQADLRGRRTVRINLYHSPGAGGTTVARRVIWENHTTYPCGILHRTEPKETIERLQHIVASTGQPTLILADGSDVLEGELDELFEYVRARHLPVVILQVLRRFNIGNRAASNYSVRTRTLSGELLQAECQRFAHVLSREAPERTLLLDQVATSQPDRLRTPFYYCLQAFGEDFTRLDSYVGSRLEGLTDVQKRILGFLSIAHHYGQKSVPAQAFAQTLGIPDNHQVSLPNVLSPKGLDLVVEVGNGEWRTSHDLIARELLEQLLSPGTQYRHNWRQNLSTWAIEFGRFCRGNSPVASETMLEVARRTFLYRGNDELLGTERAATRQFARLIGDIPIREGRLEVLLALANEYSDEAHFWAHLGRFYAIEMHDFAHSIECIDKALALQPDDAVLHHMKGMGLRSHAVSLIEQRASLPEVIEMTKQASECFSAARDKNPDNEHGYISEVQLITRVLDYAGRQHPSGLLGYISSPRVDPFVQGSFERSEGLLEQIRRNREGKGVSTYEDDCRARLDSLYGKHDQALQVWDNMLQRREVYSPPIRRQIVWTYLARKGRSWDALGERELIRSADLLEANLNEEPSDGRNMRMWVQATRRIPDPPSIESVIEKAAYWEANTGSIDATYYLFVLNSILALEGSVLAGEEAERHLLVTRNRARLRQNRTVSFEWVGSGQGLSKLVHYSRLGDRDSSTDFWQIVQPLSRVRGRISRIRGPEAGHIEVTSSLSAFFVPAKAGYALGRSENQAVDFYLGFSYEGLRAWEVKSV